MNRVANHEDKSSAVLLAEAYLDDLNGRLAHADPRERAETTAAISEQLFEAAAQDPSGEEVRRRIDELGPVDAIAVEIAPQPTPGATASGPAQQRPQTDWLGVIALVGAIVALLSAIAVPLVAIPLAIAALVLAVVQLRRPHATRGFGYAALAMSAIALVVALLPLLFLVSFS